jgi:hypothetical protein
MDTQIKEAEEFVQNFENNLKKGQVRFSFNVGFQYEYVWKILDGN